MLIRDLISNPLHIILLFSFLIGTGWYLLVKKYPLTKTQWKQIDYLWLPITAISVFGLVDQNRLVFSEIRVTDLSSRLDAAKFTVMDRANVQWICMKLQKSAFSPENFEDLEKQRLTACEWIVSSKQHLDSTLSNNEPIDKTKFNHVTTVTEPHFLEPINDLMLSIEEYNTLVLDVQAARRELRMNPLIGFMIFLSPMLLTFAFALRFVKTMGEIGLDKKASIQKRG